MNKDVNDSYKKYINEKNSKNILAYCMRYSYLGFYIIKGNYDMSDYVLVKFDDEKKTYLCEVFNEYQECTCEEEENNCQCDIISYFKFRNNKYNLNEFIRI